MIFLNTIIQNFQFFLKTSYQSRFNYNFKLIIKKPSKMSVSDTNKNEISDLSLENRESVLSHIPQVTEKMHDTSPVRHEHSSQLQKESDGVHLKF